MSPHTISCHTTSYHIISHHTTSRHVTSYHISCAASDTAYHRSYPVWASIAKGGVRSKPKRHRANRNQNGYANNIYINIYIKRDHIYIYIYVTCVARYRQRVQHGIWAPKIETISKPTYGTMLKSNRSNREYPDINIQLMS